MRVMVVWCPDWSVVAALEEADRSLRSPAAVLSANVVEVCNGPARAEGVRRGQRRRDAQARCPELLLLTTNPDRDARCFEPVLAMVEALRPGVAALRPGCSRSGPRALLRGRDQRSGAACQTLVDTGVWDCGSASPTTCSPPSRPPGGRRCRRGRWSPPAPRLRSSAACRSTCSRPTAPGVASWVGLLRRLGLRTLGDLAALPGDAVQHRLGRYGARVWRRARGEAPTLVAARTPPPDLDAEVPFEPPLDSVEAICFSVRTTAERLVAHLAPHQLVATGVRVEAESDGVGVLVARSWLHPRHFSARDLVDRVHWQLQSAGSTSGVSGSLRGRKDAGVVRAPIDRVRFVPEASSSRRPRTGKRSGGRRPTTSSSAGWPGCRAWSASTPYAARCCRAVAARRARQALVPWGERAVDLRPVDRPWPGRVPGPAPVRVFAPPGPPRWSTTAAARCASPTAAW